ncbi:shikimate dehydrogenase [Streptomyces sp. NPDC102467]|uniref:shikimate dehydrogenase n=1 Tax=Streptomyces sp. NPDC102467 TaxID=3366179 RepID=UPI00380F3830
MKTLSLSRWDGVEPRPEAALRAAVLGSPIAHSLSPVLHRSAYTALGLDWTYTAVECDERGLRPFLESLDASWAGLSLTMPLKRPALPLIDEVSDVAMDTGGVNTIVFRDGGMFGDNTDVYGIACALREAGVDAPQRPVILGGGATACSALAALRNLGVRDIAVVVREKSRGGEVCAAASRIGVMPQFYVYEDLANALDGADVVLSTLPAGAADPYAPAVAGSGAALLDVVYANWPTRLAKAVSFNGGSVVPGLSMLLHQAVRQVQLMTGCTRVPVAVMLDTARGEVERRERQGGSA